MCRDREPRQVCAKLSRASCFVGARVFRSCSKLDEYLDTDQIVLLFSLAFSYRGFLLLPPLPLLLASSTHSSGQIESVVSHTFSPVKFALPTPFAQNLLRIALFALSSVLFWTW